MYSINTYVMRDVQSLFFIEKLKDNEIIRRNSYKKEERVTQIELSDVFPL